MNMENDKYRLDKQGLDLYTKRMKEWIFQLFRRVHARIGHVEEDLAKVKREVANNYQLEKTNTSGDDTTYTLMEKTTMTKHGSITINSKGFSLQWEEVGGPIRPN